MQFHEFLVLVCFSRTFRVALLGSNGRLLFVSFIFQSKLRSKCRASSAQRSLLD